MMPICKKRQTIKGKIWSLNLLEFSNLFCVDYSLTENVSKKAILLKVSFVLSKTCYRNFAVAWRLMNFLGNTSKSPCSWLPLSAAVDRLINSTGKTSSTGKDPVRLLSPFFCLRLHSVSAAHSQPSLVIGDRVSQYTLQAIRFQCFTALPVQKHFLTSNLNLP